MKSDQEVKTEMILDMLNDITNENVCKITSVDTREIICDDLIRHGWRK